MEKFHNDRGETFIEVLGAILIAALSVTLMFSCIMWSTHEDKNVKKQDEQHYDGLTTVDAQDAAPTPEPPATPAPEPTDGSVTITNGATGDSTDIDILIYSDGGMSSYRRK